MKNSTGKTKTIALIVPYVGGGGAERVAADLSFYFSSKGYQVIFFIQHRVSGVMEYPHAGDDIVIPMTYMYSKDTRIETISVLHKEVSKLRKLKKEYSVDISISFMPESNMLNILSRHHDKVIVTLHNVVSKRKEIPLSICHNKWVYRYLYQLADNIIFVSKYCQKDWYRNYGDILHKTRLIYNPVRKMKHVDNEITEHENKRLLFCARFDGIKRPWHVIRMFSGVLEKIPDAQLIMLGDGMLMSSMKKLAEDMGIVDKILFEGRVENVEDYLKTSRLLVLTSASEAFPCAVIEAMQCGVPVVANDCPGGIREAMGIRKLPKENGVMPAYCGLITPFLDGKKYSATDKLSIEEMCMADAVVRLLTEQKLYDRCSRNCRQRAKRFELERIGEIWEDLIR